MTLEAEIKVLQILNDQAVQISKLIATLKALTEIVEAQGEEILVLQKLAKNA